MNVSKRLITLRTQCGFTQNKLAELAGVSQSHLRRVELGEADITVSHLQLLCDALDISLKDFYSNQELVHYQLNLINVLNYALLFLIF